jgi:hypothetical protein
MSEAVTIHDPIAAAIAKAQAAAAELSNLQAASAGAISTTVAPAASTAVAPVAPGKPVTMDDMLAGGISVDSWLGVKEFGLVVGPNKELFTDVMKVAIDMTAVAPHFAIKFGNPPTYLKTYDRVICAQGGSWAQAIQRAQQVDPRAREYRSADLPMLLLHDVTLPKAKEPVLTAGTKLGYSLSTTNWAAWEAVYREALKAGLAGSVVEVELGSERRTNKNGNAWGIVTFKFMGEYAG